MKRVRTLVIPFFIWILSFWTFAEMCYGFSCLRKGTTYAFSLPTLQELGIWHADCPVLTPLWYVRGLFILVLISPVLTWLLKRYGRWTLVALLIVYGVICPYAPMIYSFDLQRVLYGITRCGVIPVLGIFYFALGMAIRVGIVKVKMSKRIAWCAIVFSVAIIGLRAYLCDSMIAPYLGMLSIPLALYGVWNMMPDCEWPHWLIANSFAVFLIHKFVLLLLRNRIPCVDTSVLAYFSLAAIAFIASIFLANVVRRMLPRVATVIFGGR